MNSLRKFVKLKAKVCNAFKAENQKHYFVLSYALLNLILLIKNKTKSSDESFCTIPTSRKFIFLLRQAFELLYFPLNADCKMVPMKDYWLSEKAILRPTSGSITSGSMVCLFFDRNRSVDSCLSFQQKNEGSWGLCLIRRTRERRRKYKVSRQDRGCKMIFRMPLLTGMLLIVMLNTCGDGGLPSFLQKNSAHSKHIFIPSNSFLSV